jgi:glycosyltransferase involved in cell wall biosynthesis
LYRRERPDIVHHVALKPVVYGSIAARLANVSIVINALAGMGWLFTSGSGRARWLKPLVRSALGALLRNGTALVQNPDDGRLLQEIGVVPERIRVIPGSGVDLGVFRFVPEGPGPAVTVLPARLLWPKGVAEFVEAARILRRRGIEARFILAGTPDAANPSAVPSEEIERWVSEGIVTHLGWAGDMPQVLAGSHIVCLPSYYGEGIPKALIEAAAAGRAIITTDMPGCREIVHHEENGLLVPPRDATAVADAVQRLIEDPALRVRLGCRGRERAEQEFGLDAIVRQTLALYGGSGA